MGLFSKKQEVYKVYSKLPNDPNNTRVVYTPTRELAEQQATKLRQREKHVKIKKV